MFRAYLKVREVRHDMLRAETTVQKSGSNLSGVERVDMRSKAYLRVFVVSFLREEVLGCSRVLAFVLQAVLSPFLVAKVLITAALAFPPHTAVMAWILPVVAAPLADLPSFGRRHTSAGTEHPVAAFAIDRHGSRSLERRTDKADK
jgi:hypothetical protein